MNEETFKTVEQPHFSSEKERLEFYLKPVLENFLRRRIEFDNLQERDLQGVVICFDIDGTLRGLFHGFEQLDPGGIPPDSLELIKKITRAGAVVVISTDNPLNQHWLTGNRMLRTFKKEIPEAILFYPKEPVIGLARGVKRQEKRVGVLAKTVSERLNEISLRALLVVDDSPLGEKFASLLQRNLQKLGRESFQTGVIKLKSPLDRLPRGLRKIG